MKQYLLAVYPAVYSGEAASAPSDEETQEAYAAVDAFNAELESAGAWVFRGGLHPPETATVVKAQGGQVVTRVRLQRPSVGELGRSIALRLRGAGGG